LVLGFEIFLRHGGYATAPQKALGTPDVNWDNLMSDWFMRFGFVHLKLRI